VKKLSLFVLSTLLIAVAARGAVQRPPLSLGGDSSPAGCAGASGRYVALLVPGEGLLVLSRADFPGAVRVGAVSGGRLDARVAGVGSWTLAVDGEEGPVWGLFDRLDLAGAPPGCIAFDKDRFTWEDDLLTYVRWIVQEAFLPLPRAIRDGALPFVVSDRTVRIRAGFPGQGSIDLEGKEASTLAFRAPDGGPTYLLRPFVVDAAVRLLAVQVAVTDGAVLGPSDKQEIGTLVVGPEPVDLDAGAHQLRLQVTGIESD
jgi:hypothetical protein